jgi:hypothetical protein
MNPRLEELLRQRQLVQHHLAWLEREIEEAARQAPAPSDPIATPAPASAPGHDPTRSGLADTPPAAAGNAEAVDADADEILAGYQSRPEAVQQDVRSGCIRIFVIGMLLMLASVVAFYFTWKHFHLKKAGAEPAPHSGSTGSK